MAPVPDMEVVRQLLPRLEAAVRQDPLLAAAVGAGLLLAVLVVGLLIRRWRRTPGESFVRVLASTEAVTILMHPNPDPDAMAAAVGVDHLARSVDTETTIQYSGEISHQENRAFRTVLNCDFKPIESSEELEYDEIILVDHNVPRGFDGSDTITPFAVVDHHPGDGTGRRFTDVRTEYGACASIIAEYCQSLGLQPVRPDEAATDDYDHHPPGRFLPGLIATGLLYGILADTQNLTKGCSHADFDAAAYLFPGIDEDALDRIANPPVDATVLDTVAEAIDKRTVRMPFAVSDVGTVENVDAIPQAADDLLQLEGITAVVVYGDHDGTLHISGRSRDDRVHMGDALSAVVDDIPMSEAGGHARMGGGQISLTHLDGLRSDSGLTREDLTERLFTAMGGDAKALSASRT